MTTFSSLDDAIAKGFVVAAARQYVVYRHCNIIGHDTSGRGFRGLTFGLRVEVPEELTKRYLGVLSDRVYGQSTNIHIANANSDNARSLPMFEPHVFDDAVRLCKTWTDSWLQAHPEALARIKAENLTERASDQVSA